MGSTLRLAVAAALSVIAIAACAAPPPEEASGQSHDMLQGGRQLSEEEAATVIRQAGFPETAVGQLVCTIKYESNFYDGATNKNTNGTTDYGLFQINSAHLGESGCPTTVSPLLNVTTNARCALHVYTTQGINAWYGYQAHSAECDSYPAPGFGGGIGTPIPGAPIPGAPIPGGSCLYQCSAYGYGVGECRSGYSCRSDGCLVATSACNGTQNTPPPYPGGGGSCQLPCSSYGYAFNDCRGGYYCGTDGCLVSSPSCNGNQQPNIPPPGGVPGGSCQFSCSEYGYSQGECDGGYYCGTGDCLQYNPSCN